MAIYKVEGGYVISSHQCWIPGIYENERAAKYAFKFDNSVLQKLQDSTHGGVITFRMLQDERVKQKPQKFKERSERQF